MRKILQIRRPFKSNFLATSDVVTNDLQALKPGNKTRTKVKTKLKSHLFLNNAGDEIHENNPRLVGAGRLDCDRLYTVKINPHLRGSKTV